MTQARFKIVFDGELMPEVAMETAKDNLVRLFKSDRTRINTLFSGSTIAIKRDLHESEADQYLAALHRAGAKARKEPDLAASLSLVETDEHRPALSTSDASASMTCPKCGQQQDKALECSACGIVIEKFIARQALPAESPAAAPGPSPTLVNNPTNTPYAPPQAAVGETLPAFGELNVFTLDGRIGRLRYLAWSLVLVFAMTGIMAVVAIAASISEILGGLLGIAVMIGMLVVSVQIGVQRLHDIGWSGWLLLLNIVPIVNSVFWLLMLAIPGSAGANRFGPPPPANSLAVKVLAGLFLTLLIGSVLAMFLGGFAMLAMLFNGLDLSALNPPSS
ncbi:DUF805 domain-containing protein [Pseudomonas sp. UBA2684]|uniref:DUF805 domain-containing protein n=1 Tax=Pseudomonas sp. UBA2684 TaxID=1947311 RepID=UPI000E82B247|nr:DUF805 domain-containing protein [Pseudomonas sp. UBA2684]HBX56929.1 DUF805 domain-containing protein [Pseudomonas sp.]|tara:strand:+ start:332 stop:1333 length:1002 start_codon:yes stop_codon:yes gene_type:complete